MLERETDAIITTVTQRTLGTRESVTVKEILAAEIPHPVKTFFRADVEAILGEELRAQHKASRFNYQHPEVQNLQKQIGSIVVLEYSFRRPEFMERLDESVHMLGNFLIRPQWTLLNALFEQDQKISASALTHLLRHFGPYEYLRDLLTHYIRDKNVASFTRDEFSSLVSRMDGEYIRRKAGGEMARVMSPVFDYFDFPVNSGAKSLPVNALIRYFEDKRLSTVISRLEGEASQGKQELGLRELGELLEAVRRTSGAFEVDKWEPEPPAMAGSADGAPAMLLILNSISDGDRRRIVRKIFHQDESSFTTAVTAIGSLGSWKEASKFIDEILIRNDVDPYSSEAERFVEIISRQFQPVRS
jgi:hypothetical protein